MFKELWLRGEAAQSDAINVQRIYIDINDGNLTDGIMFSQIMYWHGYDRQGKPRLKVRKSGHLWLVKKYGDWWDECRVNEHTARKSIERIIDRGLLSKAIFKFNGAPTVHIRINWPEFEKRIKSIWHNRSDGNDKNGQIEMTSQVRSLTETTTENTTEIVKPTRDELESIADDLFAELVFLLNQSVKLMTINMKREYEGFIYDLFDLTPPARPGDIEHFGLWWYAEDWRGKKGQKPTLSQIRQHWNDAADWDAEAAAKDSEVVMVY